MQKESGKETKEKSEGNDNAKHRQSQIRVQAGIGNTCMFTRAAYITAKLTGYQEQRRVVFYWIMGPC
jgi:hypothetical protein